MTTPLKTEEFPIGVTRRSVLITDTKIWLIARVLQSTEVCFEIPGGHDRVFVYTVVAPLVGSGTVQLDGLLELREEIKQTKKKINGNHKPGNGLKYLLVTIEKN